MTSKMEKIEELVRSGNIKIYMHPTNILTLQYANCPNIVSDIGPIQSLLSLYVNNKLENVFSVGENFFAPEVKLWFQQEIVISILKSLLENGMVNDWYFVQGVSLKYNPKKNNHDHIWLEPGDWAFNVADHIHYIRNEKHSTITVSNFELFRSLYGLKLTKRISFPALQKLIDKIEKRNYAPGEGFDKTIRSLEE